MSGINAAEGFGAGAVISCLARAVPVLSHLQLLA